MIEFAAKHNIMADIEAIPISTAMERVKLIGRDSAEIRVQNERERSPYAARIEGRARCTAAVRSTERLTDCTTQFC